MRWICGWLTRNKKQEIAALQAEIARLKSHLPHTADGVLIIDCQRLYCPKCGNEVARATEITKKDVEWKCCLCLPCRMAWRLNEVLSFRRVD